MTIHPYLIPKKTIGIAHRGGRFSGAENTMEAFENAISLGYKYIETDLHITKDQQLVVFHDYNLDRLTNASGPLHNYTLKELKTLKINNKFQIPSLNDLFKTWPDIFFNLDAKSNEVIIPLSNYLKKNKVSDRVCVGSFSGSRLKKIRSIFGPKLCTSASPLEVLKVRMYSYGMPITKIEANCLQVPKTYYGIQIVDKLFLKAAKSLGLKVHVWTVNDKQSIEKLLDLGVDGIITDETLLLKNILEKRKVW